MLSHAVSIAASRFHPLPTGTPDWDTSAPTLSVDTYHGAVARETCAARLRALYALFFHACGQSHRAAQRILGRDVRGLINARDFPSLDCVLDLAAALGVAPGTTVALLASQDVQSARAAFNEACCMPRVHCDATFDARVLCADLDDDPLCLGSLLEEVPPTRSALRQALLARYETMRGGARSIRACLREDSATRVDPLAAMIQMASDAECELATTWFFDDALQRNFSPDASGSLRAYPIDARLFHECDQQAIEVCALRAWFHRESVSVLRIARRQRSLCSTHRDAVETLLRGFETRTRGAQPMARVWAASIVGLTVLGVLRCCVTVSGRNTRNDQRDPRAEARLRRIVIELGFVLDDLTRCGDRRAERLACARRARLVLAEQAVRAADGEDILCRADEHDWREVQAAAMRFPDAGGFIQHFRNQTTFSQLAHFAIDASSADRRMRALVPVHASRVAAACSRSESRC